EPQGVFHQVWRHHRGHGHERSHHAQIKVNTAYTRYFCYLSFFLLMSCLFSPNNRGQPTYSPERVSLAFRWCAGHILISGESAVNANIFIKIHKSPQSRVGLPGIFAGLFISLVNSRNANMTPRNKPTDRQLANSYAFRFAFDFVTESEALRQGDENFET
ncbi:hypothetical protein HN011_011040, partial [Eciton burchellii]